MATTMKFLIVGDDQASSSFARFARSVEGATVATDRNSAALKTQSKTAQVAAGATLSLAKSDKILADAEEVLSGRAEEAALALRQQGKAAEEAAAKTKLAGESAKGAGSGITAMLSPMGLAIAAGVELAPILVTVGAGLGGLGLAALATTKNAGEMNAVFGPLKRDVTAFQQSLQPEVLAIFGDGAGIAAHALKGLQPVAAATGTALHGVLGQVGAELRSGEWNSFFSFMAKSAGPDVQLLGQNLTDLVRVLPQLLTQLQPAGTELLQFTDSVVKLVNGIEQVNTAVDKAGDSSRKGASWLGVFGNAVKTAAIHAIPGVDASEGLAWGLGKVSSLAPGAAAGVGAAGDAAGKAAPKVLTLAQEVVHLNDAYSAALSPMLAYTNAQLAQANDAEALRKALKASHDQVGLGTAVQRASFGAANTYIQDLLNTAQAAGKSGQGIGAQISAIHSALPVLEHVRGGTKAYWQEVQQLVGWLNRLNAEKAITERVTVFGNGTWTRNATTGPGSVGGGHQLAAGGLVSGGLAGRDSVAAMLMPGEVVVPAGMVAAGAVDHLRGRLPGFAAGGIVPRYSGALKGLQPWAAANNSATIAAAVSDIASAMAAQFAASVASASAGVTSTAIGGDAAANRALAMRMFPWPSSMWPSFDYLEMREAGYNRFARNPSSGAYGIPQALPPTKMPFAAQAAGGSHAGPQLSWMYGYIGQVYRNPVNAAAHERAVSWYGGGLDAVFRQPTVIGVGDGGPEHVTVTPGGRRGGGDTYNTYNHNVTVTAPPGTHPAQLGKEIARLLTEFERINGKNWRD